MAYRERQARKGDARVERKSRRPQAQPTSTGSFSSMAISGTDISVL